MGPVFSGKTIAFPRGCKVDSLHSKWQEMAAKFSSQGSVGGGTTARIFREKGKTQPRQLLHCNRNESNAGTHGEQPAGEGPLGDHKG